MPNQMRAHTLYNDAFKPEVRDKSIMETTRSEGLSKWSSELFSQLSTEKMTKNQGRKEVIVHETVE
jgi:hypothetical protein